MKYSAEKSIAMAAVREAAELCQLVQETLASQSLEKTDRSPVTIADFGSQALICSRLRQALPEDPIIAEETSEILREEEASEAREGVLRYVRFLRPDASSSDVLSWIDYGNQQEHTQRHWTLDPIDGTKGFLRGDQYAIALALIVEGKVVVAAVGCPNLSLSAFGDSKGVIAVAVKGQGTEFYRLRDMELLGDASVTEIANPSEARFSESVESGHTSHSQSALISKLLGIQKPATRLDSQAKYVVVAAGDAEIYMRLPTSRRYVENIWDHAAGMLIVQESGGQVTDTLGAELDFGLGYQLARNRGILVSNGKFHGKLLQAIADTTPED